jgi:hypothetical protein
MTIYYIYRKDTGEYAGSGTPKIDNKEYENTTVPVAKYGEGEMAYWDGKKWEVR